MKQFAIVLLVVCVLRPGKCCLADIQFLGSVTVPGTTTDLAFPSATRSKKKPTRFGGISALDYTGTGSRFLLLSDKGAGGDGPAYQCRFHEADITIKLPQPGATSSPAINFRLIATHLLTREDQRPLIGDMNAFNPSNTSDIWRFDPEGLRCGPNSTVFVSDEFGPSIFQFESNGRRTKSWPVPIRFLARYPAKEAALEARLNPTGRQANGGFEGLAISPDRTRLWACLQRPLLQDNPSQPGGKKGGNSLRILELDLQTSKHREYVYLLETKSNGVCEILGLSNNSCLVLERDGLGGDAAKYKRIYRVELAQATDVSAIDNLPSELPNTIRPVQKTLFLDLLDARFGLRSTGIPEKWEGLSFGPPIGLNRRSLVLAVDNDFEPNVPSRFFVFSLNQSTGTK